jgi:ribonuclease HIII
MFSQVLALQASDPRARVFGAEIIHRSVAVSAASARTVPVRAFHSYSYSYTYSLPCGSVFPICVHLRSSAVGCPVTHYEPRTTCR